MSIREQRAAGATTTQLGKRYGADQRRGGVDDKIAATPPKGAGVTVSDLFGGPTATQAAPADPAMTTNTQGDGTAPTTAPAVPVPRSMSTTLSLPGTLDPGTPAQAAAPSATQAPSPLIPGAAVDAAPAKTPSQRSWAALGTTADGQSLGAPPSQQAAPVAVPATPKQAQSQVTDLMGKYGFDDATTGKVFRAGAVAVLNSKDPDKIADYMAHVAQYSAAVSNGDFKRAANIGLAMSDKGYIEANQATTITDRLDGSSTETQYGRDENAARKETADAKEIKAKAPLKGDDPVAVAQKRFDDAKKALDETRFDPIGGMSMKDYQAAKAQKRSEFQAAQDELTRLQNLRSPVAMPAPAAVTSPRGRPPLSSFAGGAQPKPPAGFTAL